MIQNKRPCVDTLNLSGALENLRKISIATDKTKDKQEVAISPAVLALIALVESISGYSTKGKEYPALCEESELFATIQYALQLTSWVVNLKNRERKEAIKTCPRPDASPKKTPQRSIEEMSDIEIREYLSAREQTAKRVSKPFLDP